MLAKSESGTIEPRHDQPVGSRCLKKRIAADHGGIRSSGSKTAGCCIGATDQSTFA
jgi:hypothetical protein